MGEDIAVLAALGLLFFGVPFLVALAIDLCAVLAERKRTRIPVTDNEDDR